MKGVAFQNAIKVLDEIVPGGYRSVVERLSAELQECAQQRFLPTSWYDYTLFDSILHCASAAAEKPFQELCTLSGSRGAQLDTRGIYRMLVRVASVPRLLRNMEPITRAYYNFSPLQTHALDDHHAEFERAGFPLLFADGYAFISEGYVCELMRRSGVNTVKWAHDYKPSGIAHGMALVDVRIHLSWS